MIEDIISKKKTNKKLTVIERLNLHVIIKSIKKQIYSQLLNSLRQFKRLIALHLLYGGDKIQYPIWEKYIDDLGLVQYRSKDIKENIALNYIKYAYEGAGGIGYKEHQILTLSEYDFSKEEILRIAKCSESYYYKILRSWRIPTNNKKSNKKIKEE